MKEKKIKTNKKNKTSKLKKTNPRYYDYYMSLKEDDKNKLNVFFEELNERLIVLGSDKKDIKYDFERAFVEYHKMGFKLERAFELLDLSNLGGFYSRNPNFWLPLDEVGKSYTQWLNHNKMAVFREAFYLKERIKPEILQMALNFTIKRFPYFAMSVKRGVFWHYLDSIRRRFKIEKEGPIPVQRIPISVSGSKTFRVLFYENRISVEFFHCLTDGTGAKEFLKSLTATYLKLLGKDIKPSNLIMDINSIVDTKEFANEYTNVKKEKDPKGFINKKALQLSGAHSSIRPCRVFHFRIPTDKLKEAAKKYGVGLTAYVSTIIMFSAKDSIDALKGDISLTIPVNMRKHFSSITLRNFSLYTSLRKPIEQIRDFEEVCKANQESLKTGTNTERMIAMAGATANMMNNMRFLPLPLKALGTKTLFLIFGDNVFTVPFSNLGVCELPEDMASEIVGMDFVLGTSTINRAEVGAVSVNGTTCLTISKYTKDPSFEERFYNILKSEGLEFSLEGSELNGI